jgi:hypothetical protein
MALRFREFQHKETGERIYLPTGRVANFYTAVKKIIHYVRYNFEKYYVVHVTLTVAENLLEVDWDHVHRVMNFIKKRIERAGGEIKYILIKEYQKRGAIHFHMLGVYNKPYIFPSSDDIAKSWRLGFVKVTAPKVRLKLYKVVSYLAKYIGKGYEFEYLETKKSFTASQIPQIYKLSASRLFEVIIKFGKETAERFICTYRRVYKRGISLKPLRTKNELVMEFPSKWAFVGYVDEPF